MRRRRIFIMAALLTTLSLVAAAGPGVAASPRTLLVTTNERSCPACALPEATRPRRLAYRDGERLITITKLRWEHWGETAARATGATTVTIGRDVFPGFATVRAFRALRHAALCRALSSDRIYTRLTVRPGTAAPVAARRVTLALPSTGCVRAG